MMRKKTTGMLYYELFQEILYVRLFLPEQPWALDHTGCWSRAYGSEGSVTGWVELVEKCPFAVCLFV